MSETTEFLLTVVRGLAVLTYAFFYSLGGMNQKLWRRLAAPLAFIAFMLFLAPISFKTLSLLVLILPLWLGYGGGEYEHRVVYAIISGLSGAFVCSVYGSNGMAVFQFILTVYTTTYLGVLNPVNARREEFLIGALSVIGIAFTI
jgi:hypothetical protein